MAGSMNLPYLGSLPIHPALRINGDAGTPLENWKVAALVQPLDAICEGLAQQISIATHSGKLVQPTMSVS